MDPTVSGYTAAMDAIALLTADHNRVRGLFARFKEADEADDVAAMRDLAAAVATELRVHTRIEEEVFYPEVRRGSDELEETVAEGIEEHHVVDVLLDEVEGLEPGAEDWVAKMTVMIENVEHHAGEEEDELFPAVRRIFSADDLAQQAERLEARKKDLGAPTVADKEHLTVEELRSLAQEQGIPGRSQMDRDELLATVAPG
jgi:hemerythrin-like domain-containing protein